ncbi:MAG: hypothetical protein IJO13_00745 [Lachnospiraceae bacterium]|nr:hypothetical protein [Lachnospiraceae bacterium]
MPKHRRLLSAILAVWLCMMLIAFTYTWVSRNWTPSIKGEDLDIASAGALVISVFGDDSHEELTLNDFINVDESFTFRQVSSLDGADHFFWKDFSPQLTDETAPALFRRVGIEGDNHDDDYLYARFCLKLDETLEDSKYIFIHPETIINYDGDCIWDVNKAMRISLTWEIDGKTTTVILADVDDDNGYGGTMRTADENYKAVANLTGNFFSETAPGAVDYQTVYDLHYFDCGRTGFDFSEEAKNSDINYTGFNKDANRTLFTMEPGDTVWIDMRIWLEGEDPNCQKEIAGEDFDMILKFDSVYVN